MAQQKKDEAAEVTPRAVPLEAGEPVEVPALSQLGGTFAERAKAAKAVQSAENKAVDSGKTSTKRTRKS